MVLIIERGITPKERLRQQDIYAERMSTGEKALTLKQTMSVLYRFSYKRASLRMVCGVDEDHNEHWRSVLLSC